MAFVAFHNAVSNLYLFVPGGPLVKASFLRHAVGILFCVYIVLILITTSETIPQVRAGSAASASSSPVIEVSELQMHD